MLAENFNWEGGKVKQGPFVIFNQQFLTLIKAGLPILNALDLLIKRQKDGNMKSLLQNVRERVKSGELLSDSFAAQGVFPRIYTTTLMAGEKSGNIEEVLGRYIAFQRLALTFKKKLAVSLVYPALLVTMVMVMIVFLVTYVVPEFAKLFENLNAKLPAITVLMLEVGTRAQKLAPFLAIGAVVIVAFFWRWKNTDRGAEQIDSVILKMPLLGDIWLKYQVANFSRMLSTLLAGGLPLVPSLETAGASMSSRRILNGIVETAARVREGQTLSGSLEQQKMFPDLSVEMIEVGRIHRSIAGDAEFGRGILRRRCSDGAGRDHGPDRAGDFDRHGGIRWWSIDFACICRSSLWVRIFTRASSPGLNIYRRGRLWREELGFRAWRKKQQS